MPDMDGFETAELISSMDFSYQIPIIFITAYRKDEMTTFKGHTMGAVDYLYKPIEPHILLSKVKIFLKIHEQNHKLEQKKLDLEKSLQERNDLLQTIQAKNIKLKLYLIRDF